MPTTETDLPQTSCQVQYDQYEKLLDRQLFSLLKRFTQMDYCYKNEWTITSDDDLVRDARYLAKYNAIRILAQNLITSDSSNPCVDQQTLDLCTSIASLSDLE